MAIMLPPQLVNGRNVGAESGSPLAVAWQLLHCDSGARMSKASPGCVPCGVKSVAPPCGDRVAAPCIAIEPPDAADASARDTMDQSPTSAALHGAAIDSMSNANQAFAVERRHKFMD
ncbi:MAG: hypothetical protein ABI843_14870 [Dokdonella sp.]